MSVPHASTKKTLLKVERYVSMAGMFSTGVVSCWLLGIWFPSAVPAVLLACFAVITFAALCRMVVERKLRHYWPARR